MLKLEPRPEALAVFLSVCHEISHREADALGSRVPRNFAKNVPKVLLSRSQLSNRKQKRSDLIKMSADRSVDTLTVCFAVFAWGAMHVGNLRKLLNCKNEAWLDLAHLVRHGKLKRREAYEAFSRLAASGDSPGLGPSYFTKLIHFLMPRKKELY